MRTSRPRPRVAGVVLAAGESRRFGGARAKQLAELDGEPLVRRACRCALSSRLDPVVVVLGHAVEEVRDALAGLDLDLELVFNRDFARGQSTSVRCGIGALGVVDGALFMPIDQPGLRSEHLDRLIEKFAELEPDPRGRVVVPTAKGRRGSPVLFGRAHFPRLLELEGDAGGRQLLADAPGVVTVELEEPLALEDVDTSSELDRLESRLAHSRRHSLGVPAVLRLEGAILPYAWGSRRFLAEREGRPWPTAQPEAELWIGAHATASATVDLGKREVPLDQYLAAHPRQLLGAAATDAAEMPYLLKVLAASEPLSIQLHPTEEQAREGFAREQHAGLGPNAPERSYRDPHAKPELVCALEPFSALWGFREPAAIASTLAQIGHAALAPLSEPLAQADSEVALEGFLARLLSYRDRFDPSLGHTVAEALATVYPEVALWIERLARHHPNDPCQLAPLFLNLVELQPGEALATGAGVLHSYLRGAAVELMGCSDNVVRCGLTQKHVDGAELMRLARFEPMTPRVERGDGGGSTARTFRGDAGLQLERVVSGSEPTFRRRRNWGPETVLAVEGVVRVGARRDGQLAEVTLRPHDAALVPATTQAYELTGDGVVFIAACATTSRLT